MTTTEPRLMVDEAGDGRAAAPPERRSFGQAVGAFFYSIYAGTMTVLGAIFEPIQRVVGVKNMPYVFVLPNLLIFGIFVLFPMLMNFYYAFTGSAELFPRDRPFVGLQNFRMIFDCDNYLNPATCSQDRFWRSVSNTIYYVVFQVGGMVALSLLTAVILNRNIRGRAFFRSVFFYPVLLSPVVVALIWKWVLQRDGVLNAILVALGFERMLFFTDAQWAFFWVIFISIWAQMGFFTLILLAGLQSIPKELYEAGSMDGAGGWQSFRGITLPLLMPTMLVVLVLALIRAVQVFDQAYVFTGGGPGTATFFIVQYIYETAFGSQVHQFGLASAASVVLGVSLFILTMLQLRLGRGDDNA